MSVGLLEGCAVAHYFGLHSIQLPVKHSVQNTLKRLTEYDLVRSCNSYFSYKKNGWQYDFTDGFCLASRAPAERDGALQPITYREYIDLVQTALQLNDDPFELACDTAVYIKLPPPNTYAQNALAMKRLEDALPDMTVPNFDWHFTAYFDFTLVDGQPTAEFRVHYMMRPYLTALLGLMESGEIDFIKKTTYGRRHDV